MRFKTSRCKNIEEKMIIKPMNKALIKADSLVKDDFKLNKLDAYNTTCNFENE